MKKCPYCGENMTPSPKENNVYLCAKCKRVFTYKGVDWSKIPETIQPNELKVTNRKIATGEIDYE